MKRFMPGLLALVLMAGSSNAAEKDIIDTAVSAKSFNTLVAAVEAAGLVDALKGEGPLTVFAPTDDAFAKLPKGTVEKLLKPENKQALVDVLTYHVVKGKVPAEKVVKMTGLKSLNGQQIDVSKKDKKVLVDKAQVVKTDIAASNGVIHVIDSVILPETKKIPEVAEKAGTFGTLLAAAKAAGLVDALNGKKDLTVFAPTDEAFAKLPEGTVENLLKSENKDQLVAVLTYHVVPGRVYSSDAVKAGKAKTLQGASVKIAANDKGAMVNDAKLLKTDIDAANGVIHVIDSVLLPPSTQQSSVSPKEMIKLAIHEGAPLYNHGDAEGCAHIYMETAKSLASMSQSVASEASHTLQTAMHRAESITCAHTQAWMMRTALEKAYHQLASH